MPEISAARETRARQKEQPVEPEHSGGGTRRTANTCAREPALPAKKVAPRFPLCPFSLFWPLFTSCAPHLPCSGRVDRRHAARRHSFPHESSDLKPIRLSRTHAPNPAFTSSARTRSPRSAVVRLLIEGWRVPSRRPAGARAFSSTRRSTAQALRPDVPSSVSSGWDELRAIQASTWYTRTLYLLERPDTTRPTPPGAEGVSRYTDGLLLTATNRKGARHILRRNARATPSATHMARDAAVSAQGHGVRSPRCDRAR